MMDASEKTALGVVIFICFIALALIGVGLWAFIELVQWITSK